MRPEAVAFKPTVPRPLVRAALAVFFVVLLLYLTLAVTIHGHLHRFGSVGLLFGVGQLLGLWVVVSLLGFPLRYVRSPANLLIWVLLGLVLLQVLPLPRAGPVGENPDALGAARRVLLNDGNLQAGRSAGFRAGRYSVIPGASVGVFVLAASAAGLYWLMASAVVGRKSIRRTTWAVALGLGAAAVWALIAALDPGRTAVTGRSALPALVPVLGGDSLVPAMLMALPLTLMLTLRPLGWTPRRRPERRQSRFGWFVRSGTVWSGIALAITVLVGAALGASHVSPRLRAAAVGLAAGTVLAVYVAGPAGGLGRGGMLKLAVGLGAIVALGVALGATVAGPAVETHAAPVEALHGLDRVRDAFGYGAGVTSPTAVYGVPGWPVRPGDDGDTSGYAVLIVEIGWVGTALVVGLGIGLAVHLVRRVGRARSPWTRLAASAGLAGLAANALYFGFDASALLAPNLLAAAMVLGLVAAWGIHGLAWRASGRGRLGEAHWPFVIGAVGLAGALALAENAMLAGGVAGGHDKLMHFGSFAVIGLLLCYALGPEPDVPYLKTRIVAAVLLATAMGVGIEYGQAYLTAGRAFETLDMVADAAGAGLTGLLWWVLQKTRSPHPSAA